MQLSDVDISQSTKSTIRHLVDGEIDAINTVELNILYLQDKLHTIISDWEGWLKKNFTQLNMIRNKNAG